jgi:maltose alpha-D-glucosyltransferase/alpha-amylase
MAFHFPLMPRMYMAIAKEDRFPITDIMRQMPAIPPDCQWAIFLRNHDELTLEMVTDSERDYLWSVYAGDRRARLNLGIRRRLAPLLERDRRRAELMSSLLFSMPGPPVMYYGDEIGMGDNIHLGDRDGVRTPMQWSSDRNGGFSRADPERLVLPPIMDPVAGFGAVNVESQRRNPHSLLNWTRRILAVRQRYRLFGRGEMRFVKPRNRKILAYIRKLDDQVVLCVANLAHTSQAVELDLAEFEGRVPVEIIGGTPFPPVGKLTYLLTLPQYGFYWFELRASASAPSWRDAPPEAMPEYTTIVLRNGFPDLLARQRAALETEVLPAYLPMRRWFGAKDRALRSVRVEAATPGPIADTLLAEIAADSGGGEERYLLPLGIVWDDENPTALAQQLALARVRRGPRVGYLTDAFALEPFVRALVAACRDNRRSDGDTEVAYTAAPFELPHDGTQIRWLAAEHSNSSLIVDDRVFVKLYRRIEEGPRPEAEMARRLAAAGFANTPPYLGGVVRQRDGRQSVLALVQSFVRNQGDGWTWSQDYLERAVYHTKEGAETGGIGEMLDGYGAFAATIGRRLGELHEALAQPTDDPAFAAEPATAENVAQWTRRARSELDAAIAELSLRTDWPDADTEAEARDMIARSKELLAGFDRLGVAGIGTPCMPIHGDFPLGQVLVSSGDVYIVDLEGEPAHALGERSGKSSPFKDLAGLLRSFDYASTAANIEDRSGPTREERARLLERFRERAISAATNAYATARALPPEDFAPRGKLGSLLRMFLLEKAAYEVRYEIAHRPSWIATPIRGLARLAAELTASDA